VKVGKESRSGTTSRDVVRGSALASTDTDSTLVERARGGDAAALEVLYRAHSGRVFAVCYRMAGDGELAEEWAQDAWVRAWERLDSFRGESAFTTWLHRLTVNLILDRRRSDARRRERIERAGEVARMEEEGRSNPSPGERMDLERAIATLPDGARTVFLLYDVEGFKHREIADRLGVAEGTVKAQLHRARRMLREALT
jgi:RNA polymerase sigma-70 factor, ECF subfamily